MKVAKKAIPKKGRSITVESDNLEKVKMLKADLESYREHPEIRPFLGLEIARLIGLSSDVPSRAINEMSRDKRGYFFSSSRNGFKTSVVI